MASNMITPMLFVTANVGSIFEEPKKMLQAWVTEFLKTVKRLQPQFIALHCQEIGGKNYEGSMKYVEDFVRMLMASEELVHFDRIRVFLDEDFASSERFTALGNLYFVHESITTAQIWDFKAKAFVTCSGKDVHSGNIEDVSSKEKVKYPPEFFTECKWSRKGFLRTRWNINGTLFDLINIHLFHDASNFLAIEAFPSIYSNYRHRALQYLIERLKNEEGGLLPFYVFGDFNFRLDTQGVVKKLTNKSIPQQVKSNKNGEISKLVYTEQNNDKVILTLGKKEFDHHEQHHNFFDNRGKWMREFDREVEPFHDQLSEFPISFPPSYPFCEDASSATTYMRTRCPAWCDRVLLSKDAKSLVTELPNDKDNPGIQYSTIGEGICMGDHKPVYLFFWMATDSGFPPIVVATVDSLLEDKIIVAVPPTANYTDESRTPADVPQEVAAKSKTIQKDLGTDGGPTRRSTLSLRKRLVNSFRRTGRHQSAEGSTNENNNGVVSVGDGVADSVAKPPSRWPGGANDASVVTRVTSLTLIGDLKKPPPVTSNGEGMESSSCCTRSCAVM